MSVIPNNDVANAFVSPSPTLVWREGYGYHDDGVAKTVEYTINTAGIDLSTIRSVSACITGYYNTPPGGLGDNRLVITLDNGDIYYIGTQDSWSGVLYQMIFYGTQTDERLALDLVQEVITFDVPEERTITALTYATGINLSYPPSDRGIMDITLMGPKTISGIITDTEGEPAARTVRVYERNTGNLIASTTSDSTSGEYTLTFMAGTDEYQCIALADESSLYNDILIRVIPE